MNLLHGLVLLPQLHFGLHLVLNACKHTVNLALIVQFTFIRLLQRHLQDFGVDEVEVLPSNDADPLLSQLPQLNRFVLHFIFVTLN